MARKTPFEVITLICLCRQLILFCFRATLNGTMSITRAAVSRKTKDDYNDVKNKTKHERAAVSEFILLSDVLVVTDP